MIRTVNGASGISCLPFEPKSTSSRKFSYQEIREVIISSDSLFKSIQVDFTFDTGHTQCLRKLFGEDLTTQ